MKSGAQVEFYPSAFLISDIYLIFLPFFHVFSTFGSSFGSAFSI